MTVSFTIFLYMRVEPTRTDFGFLVGSTGLYCLFHCDSRRSSRAGKVPLPGATSTAIASSGGAGGMSSSSGQGQDASSSSSLTAAGTTSANGVPVPASIPSVPGDEHAVHHANVASGGNTIIYIVLNSVPNLSLASAF